jgi:aldehyde:ferredoxin oxidoreductase
MIANPESVSFKGVKALGITEALAPRDFGDKKVQYYATLENWSSAEKVIGLCYFGPAPRSYIQVDEVVQAVRAATGWDDFTAEELLRIGERATNLAHTFNQREGFSRKDDTLPQRLFEPLEAGALKGASLARDEFERALTALYRVKGWDIETGAPTRQRLRELGIEWAADVVSAS